ncbi:putative ABC transport system ATP-binding protein [Enterococcus sp. PF1-24]|uniref:ABC transporter ATP-binding protein n=1 Tax=unclassified Enterococcus TaxID=2608891 RepID=UPI00247625C4|nr:MULTISPECIES: ABC transporter ATP-binding protein [unclassified Enterococcus]MDH6364175.1 putative ABC transport system ATP-binding protein [Enterococcus sp. PFB1-1]MDH6401276.1 putative ABC transport system ATP-binding protein [Enterococcus sp. PF1-24]
MSHLITATNVEKYYGDSGQTTKALNRVSFEVNKGEFTGIMGTSGSGKTTLLNMLATIDRVSAGQIYFEDVDITKLNEEELAEFRKKNLGFIFQAFNLIDTLTIDENIEMALSLRDVDKATRVKEVAKIMEQLGISHLKNKFPYEVSGGEKQRCACARALITEPKLILADEPTGALDSKSSTKLLSLMEFMNKNLAATILMVTHDAFSSSYCERILFLNDGEIFQELYRGQQTRREFLNTILDVLAIMGGQADAE